MIVPLSNDNVNVVMCFFIGSAFFVFRNKIYLSGRISLVLVALAFTVESTVFGRPAMFVALGYLILLFGYSRKLPIPGFVSDYSYGIYLYSFPIQSTLVYIFPDIPALILLFVSVPLSWIAGAASWYWVEKPTGRFRKKFLSKNNLLVGG
ncbi:acyltransferase family protein [Pseudomonas lini]